MKGLTNKKMKLGSASFVTITIITAGWFVPVAPVTASTIQCSELAKRFANGEANFDESLKCGIGRSEMTYGRYCSRTQGIVCSQGRGSY